MRSSPRRSPRARATSREQAAASVDAAVDRWVWYAGWADKVAQVAGSSNPVAGPFFNFCVPEPTGVVGIVAPADSSLLGLVSVLAPVLVTGTPSCSSPSEQRPLPAITLAEVLATSDVPGGVVNLLTGRVAELAPVLAAHRDVDALDLAGAPEDLLAELERAAVTNVKRVLRPRCAAVRDWTAAPTPRRMLASSRPRPSGTRSGSDDGAGSFFRSRLASLRPMTAAGVTSNPFELAAAAAAEVNGGWTGGPHDVADRPRLRLAGRRRRARVRRGERATATCPGFARRRSPATMASCVRSRSPARRVLLLIGRTHLYEGRSPAEVVHPVRHGGDRRSPGRHLDQCRRRSRSGHAARPSRADP